MGASPLSKLAATKVIEILVFLISCFALTISLMSQCAWPLLAKPNESGKETSRVDPRGPGHAENVVISFPANISVGTLTIVTRDGNLDRPNWKEARGNVSISVPHGYLLAFQCANCVRENPSLLNGILFKGVGQFSVKFKSLDDTSRSFTDGALKHMSQFPDLERLDVSESDATDDGFGNMSSLTKLRSIIAYGAEIHGKCIRSFAALPALEDLNLGLNELEPDNLRYLPQIARLKNLNLEHTHMSGSLDEIARCKGLSTVDLSGNRRIDDNSLRKLASLSCLTSLVLKDTPVTVEGVASFKGHQLLCLMLPAQINSYADRKKLRSLFPICRIVCQQAPVVPEYTKYMLRPLH